jgi:hypothetical protein
MVEGCDRGKVVAMVACTLRALGGLLGPDGAPVTMSTTVNAAAEVAPVVAESFRDGVSEEQVWRVLVLWVARLLEVQAGLVLEDAAVAAAMRCMYGAREEKVAANKAEHVRKGAAARTCPA